MRSIPLSLLPIRLINSRSQAARVQRRATGFVGGAAGGGCWSQIEALPRGHFRPADRQRIEATSSSSASKSPQAAGALARLVAIATARAQRADGVLGPRRGVGRVGGWVWGLGRGGRGGG